MEHLRNTTTEAVLKKIRDKVETVAEAIATMPN